MMRLLFISALTTLFTACQCGPGIVCKASSDCGDWGHCSSTGFCVSTSAGGGGGGGGSGNDGGLPDAVISEPHIDLGLAGCGTTSVTHEIQVLNTGAAPLTFQTSVGSSTDFQVTAGTTVPPMMQAAVTVTASPPTNMPANTTVMGVLVITTNDPSHPRFEVPLTEITQGVTLTLSPMLSSFGVVPESSPPTQVPLTLQNVGNLSATVSFSTPADLQFSIGWAGAPTASTVGVNQSAAGLVAQFAPMSIMPSSSSSAISVAEPVCGQSASTILMTGQGTTGVVGISTTDVVFGNNGLVDCGTTATSQTFVLKNGGNMGYSWTGTLGKGASSPFNVSPSGGTVPSMGMTTITVSSTGIPQTASTTTDAFGDVFTITTDAANDTAHPITLHQTAHGAVLVFNPGAVDFGLVPVNSTAAAPFTVSNIGTGPANVTLMSDAAAFAVSTTGATRLDPGDLSVTAKFSPGSSTELQTGHITVSTPQSDVLCEPLPAALTASGTGSSGSVSYSPIALDFGLVDCGATGTPNTISFGNNGNRDYTITPTLGLGTSSPYTVSMSPDSGVVAQDGGTLVITVTPLAIPQSSAITPNLFGDTLTVTTDITGDVQHNIALRETAHGAIFAISSQALDFGTVPIGVAQPSQFSVTNNGNAAGTVGFMVGNPAIFTMPSTVSVGAAASKPVNATFAPLMAQPYSDTGNLTAPSTVLCQPLPFTTMTLHGVGTSMNVMPVSPASLTFGTGGLTACGSTATAQTVAVTNSSSSTLTMAYSLALGSGSPYTVSGPATLSAGAMGTVTVTPKPMPSTALTTPDLFADTLTITGTFGTVINESHTVALHQTAQGAILTFNPSSLHLNAGALSSDTQSFTVNNTGNVSAPFTLTLAGSSDFSSSPPSGTANGGGSVTGSVTFSPGLNLAGTQHGTITLASSVGRCAPLPAALALTGN